MPTTADAGETRVSGVLTRREPLRPSTVTLVDVVADPDGQLGAAGQPETSQGTSHMRLDGANRWDDFHSSLAAREYWTTTWSTSNAFNSPARYRSIASPMWPTSAAC